MLTRAIHLRYLTVGLVVLLFVSTIASFSLVPPGFFPASTRAQFAVDYFLPQGTDIQRTQQDIAAIGDPIHTLDGVTGASSVVGSAMLGSC